MIVNYLSYFSNKFKQFLNDFKKIIEQIKESNLSPEINLFWSDISIPVLKELSGILKNANIILKSIYTLSSASKTEILLKGLKDNHCYNDFIIKEKDINNHLFHYKYNKDINDFIQTKKLLFCYDDYFICPFLYNTYFIDEKGNMHFCIKKMYTGKSIRNIYNGLSNKQNWPEGMFDNLCDEQGKNCKYSFYCSKMCDYLGHIYKPSTIDLCPIPKELDIYVKEKIKILARIQD